MQDQFDWLRRYRLARAICVFFVVISGSFIIYDLMVEKYVHALINVGPFVLGAFLFLLLKNQKQLPLVANILVALSVFYSLIAAHLNGPEGTSALYITLLFAPFVFTLKGVALGRWIAGGLYISLIVLATLNIGVWDYEQWALIDVLRYAAVLILMWGLGFYIEATFDQTFQQFRTLSQLEAQRLEQQRSVLNQALQSQTDHVSDISHDLRSPLAVVQSQLELWDDGLEHDADKILPIIQGKFQMFGKLLAQLVDKHPEAKTDLLLAPFVSGLVKSFETIAASRQLSLKASLNIETGQTLYASELQMSQLLSNLISNSLKYTDGPGGILVSVSEQGGVCLLIIEDTAPAVSDDTLPTLFERHVTKNANNRLGEGKGLGLDICKRIVEQHQGRIGAQRSALGGLKITVELPFA